MCLGTEATEGGKTSLPPVKGRLKEHLRFWKETIQASSFVLGVIEVGYVLPLMSPFCRQNQASASLCAQFVQESVTELLSSGCINEVPVEPYVCSPLSVVENSMEKKSI